ncbi:MULTISPECIES: GerMN domain-containing protein [Paenibacillus]|uniref:GerMN domain-containing protein n=1 Tax=Paenibacillus TaxID=44249 RepID=UPI00038F9C17|nr:MULTISPECIES: GerMN domain-containing protein [Paenibacillus]KKC46326.1 hypothetical protein VE23_03070 [Paenibacillus sp. D9]CDN42972.1 hypothetical protein BN871_CG_00110 [Paenibacillus sp. P22]
MNRRMNKTAVLLTAAAIALSLSACGARETAGPAAGASGNAGASEPAVVSPSPSAAPAPSPAAAEGSGVGSSAAGGKGSVKESDKVKKEISVYQTDDQLLELKAVKAEISYGSAEEKLEAALEALAGDDREGTISLWKGVQFKKVTLKEGAATADIHIPDESRLGGAGEEFALEAIRKTVFQFDEVQTFDLLVDGKAAETLMGHMELEHPMKKSNP